MSHMAGHMTALIVGDEAFRAEARGRGARDLGFRVVEAESDDAAAAAVATLGDDPHVLILQVVPGEDVGLRMRGMRLALDMPSLPVITVGDVPSGASILAGALHHLPRVDDGESLRAAVSAAAKVALDLKRVEEELAARSRSVGLIVSGEFQFRTPRDANDLAIALSPAGPQPARLALGLLELMLNAVEHGNLGIGGAEKDRLRGLGLFQEEVERRLASPENHDKRATLTVLRRPDGLSYTIEDMGAGFDWRAHDESGRSGVPAISGRGILLARSYAFERVEYRGRGNRVVATIQLPPV